MIFYKYITHKAIISFTITFFCCFITLAQNDNDGDGIIDSIDLDDDNDGILDVDESPTCSLLQDPSFEMADDTTIDDVNGFAAAYSSTITWYNVYHTAGYIQTSGPLNAHDGNAYVAFHSVRGGMRQELFGANLSSEMIMGNDYTYSFYSYNTQWASFFTGTGRVVLFGIPTGATPDFVAAAPNTMAILRSMTDVEELGSSDEVNNTTTWEQYSITFTALNNYDRIVIAIEGDGALLGFDDTTLYCSQDTDKDTIINTYDTDSDNDGCSDADEAYGAFETDTNGDGTYGGVVAAYDASNPTAADGVNALGLVNASNYTYSLESNSIIGIEITEVSPINNVTTCSTGQALFSTDYSAIESLTYSSGSIDSYNDVTGELEYQWYYSSENGITVSTITENGTNGDNKHELSL